jgi:uncharacterized protein (DUF2267 family)
MTMIDEMVEAVARAGNLPSDQAARAVGAVLRLMAARLPSPLFGELQSHLQDGAAGPAGNRPAGTPDAPDEA